MQIWYHPEIARPPGYAQLWSAEPFVLASPWYVDKGYIAAER